MDISRAIAIQGWMSPSELEWLAVQANSCHRIVEIGCFLGRSTVAMACNTVGTVFAVDDFKGPRDVKISQEDRDKVYDCFRENVQGLDNVIPVIADHADVPLDVKPDMVFIDGSHEYLDVERDIKHWLSKISIGGLLAGHDITLPGVYQAVTGLLDYKVHPGTTIWYCNPR